MRQTGIIPRLLVAALALSVVAGCADDAAPPAAAPPHDAATSGPELAGAWYQVYFDTNSAVLNQRGQMIAGKVAYVVQNDPTTRVTVIGRTDRIGAAPTNMALSQRRAVAVSDALIAAGVPAIRIDTSWTGEAVQRKPTVQDSDPRGRVVDVTVVKQSG
jgi:OOP family OmpA-OmpF porin